MEVMETIGQAFLLLKIIAVVLAVGAAALVLWAATSASGPLVLAARWLLMGARPPANPFLPPPPPGDLAAGFSAGIRLILLAIAVCAVLWFATHGGEVNDAVHASLAFFQK